jgi:hypothetical protein
MHYKKGSNQGGRWNKRPPGSANLYKNAAQVCIQPWERIVGLYVPVKWQKHDMIPENVSSRKWYEERKIDSSMTASTLQKRGPICLRFIQSVSQAVLCIFWLSRNVLLTFDDTELLIELGSADTSNYEVAHSFDNWWQYSTACQSCRPLQSQEPVEISSIKAYLSKKCSFVVCTLEDLKCDRRNEKEPSISLMVGGGELNAIEK